MSSGWADPPPSLSNGHYDSSTFESSSPPSRPSFGSDSSPPFTSYSQYYPSTVPPSTHTHWPDYSSYSESSSLPLHSHPRRDSSSSQPPTSYFYGTAEASIPATIAREPKSVFRESGWRLDRERSPSQHSIPSPQTPHEGPPLSPTSSIALEQHNSHPYPSPYAPSSHFYTHPSLQTPNDISLPLLHPQFPTPHPYHPPDLSSRSAPGNEAPDHPYPNSLNMSSPIHSNRRPSLSSLSVSSYSLSPQTPITPYDSFETFPSRNPPPYWDEESIEREASLISFPTPSTFGIDACT